MGPGFQGALGLTQHFFDEGARAFGVANHGELLGQIEFGVEGVVAVGGLGLGRWAGGQVQIQAIQNEDFEGKLTTIEPQILTDTRNIRVQATIDNPEQILKPGMFATTTVVLPEKPAVITVPETAVDYPLYGDSVYLITENKAEDGKVNLTAVRTFVRVGDRIKGRSVILSGLKAGDRVVAVGQLKLQSGASVTISPNPPPPVTGKPSPY